MDNPVDREKDEAINRILYGDEDGDARSRLEERRRRRETAKAAAPTRSIFAREPLTPEEVPSVPETPKPVLSETKYAPPEKHAPAREPESPKRRDFSGFVFGENAEERRRATESGASIPAAPQETDPFRNFTDFAVAPLQPPVYTAPAPEEVAAPADSTFALHVDEEQKTLFAIDKKNEAFQELLDEEYRRKRERDAELERLRGQVGTAAPEQNFPASTFAIPTPEPAISESETSRPAAERSDELGGEAASNPMRTSKAQPSAYTGGLTWLDQDHAAAKEAEVDTWGKILEGQETADNHAEQAVAAGANLDVDETPDWLKELESLSAGVYGSAPAPAIPKPVVPEPVMYVTPVPEPVEAVPEPAAVIPEPVIPEPVMYVTPVPEPVEAVPEPAAVIPEPAIPEPVAVIPEPVVPEPAAVIPEPVVAAPEPVMYVTPVPEPVEVVPEPVAVIPEPVIPEPVAVIPEPVTYTTLEPVTPEPAAVASAPEPEPAVPESPRPFGASYFGANAPTREQVAEFMNQPIHFPFDEEEPKKPKSDTFDIIVPAAPEEPEPVIPEPTAITPEAIVVAPGPELAAVTPEPVAAAPEPVPAPAPVVLADHSAIAAPAIAIPFFTALFGEEMDQTAPELAPAAKEEKQAVPVFAPAVRETPVEPAFQYVSTAQNISVEQSLESEEGDIPFSLDQLGTEESEESAFAELPDWMRPRTPEPVVPVPAEIIPEPEPIAVEPGPAAVEPELPETGMLSGASEEAAAERSDAVSEALSPPVDLAAPGLATPGEEVSAAEESSNKSSMPATAALSAEPAAIAAAAVASDGAVSAPLVKAPARQPAPQKRKNAESESDAGRTALSVIITILIVLLVLVIVSILILHFKSDSTLAYYIRDGINWIQEKLGFGS